MRSVGRRQQIENGRPAAEQFRLGGLALGQLRGVELRTNPRISLADSSVDAASVWPANRDPINSRQ